MRKEYLVTASEMKKYDNYTIEQIGIPSMVLMERAALAVVDAVEDSFCNLEEKRILVVCGGGNNGGDGLAVARLLWDKGCMVDVVLTSPEEKCTEQTKCQLRILQSYTKNDFRLGKIFIDVQKMLPILKENEYSIIIDALFGVGLTRTIEGRYRDWIEAINASKAYVVSVDVPSGIDADFGKVKGCAVKADLTVTFAFSKRGLYLYPGREYSGKILCRDIGITARSFGVDIPECFTYPAGNRQNKEDILKAIAPVLPMRDNGGNKGTFGKLLVIAGSRNMCGACILSAESACRTGAGMVKIVTVEENREIIQTRFPEAMLLTYKEGAIPNEALKASMAWADAVVIGPGMGQGETATELLDLVLNDAKCPVIMDADALNILAKSPKMQEKLHNEAKEKSNTIITCKEKRLILTPHQGELARLMGKTVDELKEAPFLYARELAERFECVVVSKDAATIVCDSGREIYLNSVGNSGMATAGSGDVLAGIIGGMMVQQLSGKEFEAMTQDGCNFLLESVAKSVFLHACAGELAGIRVGEHAMLAGDLIESLKEISKERT